MTIAHDLAKLVELRAQGVLTDAEFERAKARLIDEVPTELHEDDHSEVPTPIVPGQSLWPSTGSGPSVVKRRLPPAKAVSRQGSKAGGGRKWAVIAGLILGTVAVVALIVFVTTNKSTSDHQAFCQRYRDALTLAYTDDPAATLSTAGLAPKDAHAVSTDEQTYRQEYAKAADTSALRTDFDAYVQKAIPTLMAEHRC